MNKHQNGQTLAEFGLGLFILGLLAMFCLALLSPANPARPDVNISISNPLEKADPQPALPQPKFGTMDDDVFVQFGGAVPYVVQSDAVTDSLSNIDIGGIDFAKGHGAAEHAAEYAAVQECLGNMAKTSKNVRAYQRKGTNRFIIPCEVSPGVWGVLVADRTAPGKFDSVTGFIKDIIKSWDDMLQYLIDSKAMLR
jgi:hypothetical protein